MALFFLIVGLILLGVTLGLIIAKNIISKGINDEDLLDE